MNFSEKQYMTVSQNLDIESENPLEKEVADQCIIESIERKGRCKTIEA